MTWLLIGLSVGVYTVVTACVLYLLLMAVYQLYLLLSYRAKRGPDPEPAQRYRDEQLPKVTVQLPVFNEGYLAEQCLEAAAGLDYPRDRLQVQFLDDSDDRTTSALAKRKMIPQKKRTVICSTNST